MDCSSSSYNQGCQPRQASQDGNGKWLKYAAGQAQEKGD
uniref:Uncharacterized protein n=1 Tax=Arundo donax TaxID=35708 RepID=A0A0A9GH35_ARUDO